MKAFLAALLLLGSAAHAAEGFKARGFILPDGAVKIDDDRYRLSQPWDEAVKFFRRAYPPASRHACCAPGRQRRLSDRRHVGAD